MIALRVRKKDRENGMNSTLLVRITNLCKIRIKKLDMSESVLFMEGSIM